jgi:3-hydroxyisobutyrate dehydrogenase-like beta-hydroxyacid dehydrogenase
LAVDAARSAGVPLELGSFTEQIYRPLAQEGSKESNLDFSSIYAALQEK